MKNSIFKKVTAFIMVLTLTLGMFPCLNAFAAKEMFITEISSVSLNGVAQPSVGSTPLYSASVETTGCTLQTANSDTVVNGIRWYESATEGSRGTAMSTSAKCRAGYYYTIAVTLVKTGSYKFAGTVTGTVNGKTAQVDDDYDGTKIVVYYSYPMCMGTVPSVDVNLTAPVAGAKPSYTQVKGTGYESNNSRNNASCYENGIYWLETDTGTVLYPNKDVFKLGYKYTARVMLSTTKGYVYTSSPTAKVNGKAVTANKVDKEFLYVDYTFTATGTAINKVDLTIPNAIAGKYPSFPKVNTTSYESKNTDPKLTNQTNGIVWSNGSVNITVNNLFDANKTYSVSYTLFAKEGYGWSDSVIATINGKSAVVGRDGQWLTVTLYGIKPTVPHTHTPSGWKSDASGHYKVCTGCGEEISGSRVKHTPGAAATEKDPQKCTVCGYIIAPAKGHTHSLKKVAAKKATCTENGSIEYYTCSGCSDWFKDSAGKTKITDRNSIVVKATGHKKGSLRCDDSAHWNACSVCNEAMMETRAAHYDKNKDNTCDACGNAIDGAEAIDPSITVKPPVKDTEAPVESDTEAPVEDTTEEITEPEETTAEPEEDTDLSIDITAEAEDGTKAPEAEDNNEGENTGTPMWLWIVVAVAAFAVIGVIVVVIIVSKKKKN